MRNTSASLGLILGLGIASLAACSGGANTPSTTGSGGSSAATTTAGTGGGTGGSGGAVDSGRPPGVALCYTALADEHPATKAFWDAFGPGNRDARLDVIAGLEAAVKEHPKEEELALLLALANLWRVAEPLDSEAGNQGIVATSALAAKTHLETAFALCPTDYRIPAWLGIIQVNMGRAVMNQAFIDQGLATLQVGIDHYPSFVLFSKLLVFADRPSDDPDFLQALKAVSENVDACTATSNDPACGNSVHAAHNLEGAVLFMGDVFAKAGKRDEALSYYEGGKKGTSYGTWKFQALLDERIAGVDARVAASTDQDPENDPPVIWASPQQCAVCHTE